MTAADEVRGILGPPPAETVRDEVHLFFEFNRAIDTLSKRYGVLNVADQCRGYADFIQRLQAGIEMRHNDGHVGG